MNIKKVLLILSTVILSTSSFAENLNLKDNMYTQEELNLMKVKDKETLNDLEKSTCYVFYKYRHLQKRSMFANEMSIFLSDASVKYMKENKDKADNLRENINRSFNDFVKKSKEATENYLGYKKEFTDYEPDEEYEKFLVGMLNYKLEDNFIGPDYDSYNSAMKKTIINVCGKKLHKLSEKESTKYFDDYKEYLNKKLLKSYEIENFIK